MKKDSKIMIGSITAGVALCAVFNIWFGKVNVSGQSMENTYKDGEAVIVRKSTEDLKRGDVIIIKEAVGEMNLIKRVIAIGGDTINIDFDNSTVTVNGNVLDEPYIKEPTRENAEGFEYPITVPNECFFVMGDNRNNSMDSRDSRVGFIQKDNIYGKVMFALPF